MLWSGVFRCMLDASEQSVWIGGSTSGGQKRDHTLARISTPYCNCALWLAYEPRISTNFEEPRLTKRNRFQLYRWDTDCVIKVAVEGPARDNGGRHFHLSLAPGLFASSRNTGNWRGFGRAQHVKNSWRSMSLFSPARCLDLLFATLQFLGAIDYTLGTHRHLLREMSLLKVQWNIFQLYTLHFHDCLFGAQNQLQRNQAESGIAQLLNRDCLSASALGNLQHLSGRQISTNRKQSANAPERELYVQTITSMYGEYTTKRTGAF